jgi:hypothetical protein
VVVVMHDHVMIVMNYVMMMMMHDHVMMMMVGKSGDRVQREGERHDGRGDE